ncbi:hypothetical protein [Lactobacillus johnsonii]|uniref:Uncharacterized protein n=1 Tax=Lactobacillus johnsonii TaxID=33959 RepID=A0A9X4X976_LACJH|nr:hypothetical protein [Lactobacillus johnsonii]MTE03616.1 hypothetical protein [Lactobacillus johnsonii]
MEKKHVWLYFIGGLLTVIAGITVWLFIATNPNNAKMANLKRMNTKNLALSSYYQKQTNSLSVEGELNHISDTNINVQNSLNDVTKNLKSGIDLVYNKTKNEDDYSKLKSTLPKLVGNELSEQLITNDKPVLNQSGKKTLTYDKTDDVVVAFGKYDYQSVTVPIYVVVDYETPKVATSEKGDRTQSLKGQDLYILTFNLKTKKLSLDQYVKGATSNG